jgi:hypothetical protein
MCELTIAEYNKMFNENLPEDHHEQTLANLWLVLDREEDKINISFTTEKD